jgi:hypothetical protein
MNESEIFNKRVETIQKMLEENYRNLDKIKEMLSTLGKEIKRDVYKNTEGIIGTYDGVHLVDPNGNKYDVPANYAAKSRLVYGDTIKMIEDNGSTVFKQIQKVERKKTEGVLSKKEGKWVVLTDTGSYRMSEVAVDFNLGQMNDEVIVFVPASNLNAPYATLDRLVRPRLPEHKDALKVEKQPVQNTAPKVEVPAKPRPTPVTKPAPKVVTPTPVTKPTPKQETTPVGTLNLGESKGDEVTQITLGGTNPAPKNSSLDDDDLR